MQDSEEELSHSSTESTNSSDGESSREEQPTWKQSFKNQLNKVVPTFVQREWSNLTLIAFISGASAILLDGLTSDLSGTIVPALVFQVGIPLILFFAFVASFIIFPNPKQGARSIIFAGAILSIISIPIILFAAPLTPTLFPLAALTIGGLEFLGALALAYPIFTHSKLKRPIANFLVFLSVGVVVGSAVIPLFFVFFPFTLAVEATFAFTVVAPIIVLLLYRMVEWPMGWGKMTQAQPTTTHISRSRSSSRMTIDLTGANVAQHIVSQYPGLQLPAGLFNGMDFFQAISALLEAVISAGHLKAIAMAEMEAKTSNYESELKGETVSAHKNRVLSDVLSPPASPADIHALADALGGRMIVLESIQGADETKTNVYGYNMQNENAPLYAVYFNGQNYFPLCGDASELINAIQTTQSPAPPPTTNPPLLSIDLQTLGNQSLMSVRNELLAVRQRIRNEDEVARGAIQQYDDLHLHDMGAIKYNNFFEAISQQLRGDKVDISAEHLEEIFRINLPLDLPPDQITMQSVLSILSSTLGIPIVFMWLTNLDPVQTTAHGYNLGIALNQGQSPLVIYSNGRSYYPLYGEYAALINPARLDNINEEPLPTPLTIYQLNTLGQANLDDVGQILHNFRHPLRPNPTSPDSSMMGPGNVYQHQQLSPPLHRESGVDDPSYSDGSGLDEPEDPTPQTNLADSTFSAPNESTPEAHQDDTTEAKPFDTP